MGIEVASTAIVSPKARIAENVVIGPFSIIEDEVEIGAGTRLDSHVVIKNYTTLGKDNHLHMGVMLGSDPEDKHFTGERSYLKIGDRNAFREYSSASRGTPPESATVIENDNYIMIGTHVAHNCQLGSGIVICNFCSLGGHVEVEDGAFLSASVLVHQFSKIGRLAMISGNTRVNLDVPPFVLASDFNIAAHGLNLVGLRRAGISKEAISKLKEAYQILYRSKLPLHPALERIEKEIPTEEARQLVAFIRGSKRGICRDARGVRQRGATHGNAESEGSP
ncbi:MAG: acyl-ACP--UDP-N-acetylglucosamine O-acyltransferase [Acidobacteria bacterium]|nr:acyl-ACP--UDP-N-acetylglucosamine O-acyltransferase [Acidobacteriota bacterium]